MIIIRRRNNATSSNSSWSFIFALVSLFILAVIITRQTTKNKQQLSLLMSSQQQLEGEEQSTTTHEEVIVGGYSNLDNTLIKSEAVLDIANFAVEEHAARISQLFGSGGQQQQLSEDDTFLEISPEDVESGLIHIVVLEAQRQVVAGLNYKLTIALFKESNCLGALKVTVYDRFGDLKVTSWGDPLKCEDIQELLSEVQLLSAAKDDEGEKGGEEEEKTASNEEENIEGETEDVGPEE